MHFGEADLQHDLLLTTDHHEVGNAAVAGRQFHGAVDCQGRADGAGQHDAIIGGAHFDGFVGQDLPQAFAQFGDVGDNLHLDVGDQ